jgi:NTF2 fold immunity protein
MIGMACARGSVKANSSLVIRLVNNVWIVEGTLPGNEAGEAFELWIRKTNGAILHLQLK